MLAARSTDPNEGGLIATMWTTNNSYGISELTENTATTTIESTYNYVSSAGRPITLAINAGNTGAEGWTVTDGIATLIFKKTSNGYNITRRKVGYTAIGTAIVDTFGNLVSQTNNLTASLSSTFSGSVSWLNSHLQANPGAVGAKDKVNNTSARLV